MMTQIRELWEWIPKNLDDTINVAKNGNLIIWKFVYFCPHNDNPNISLSDKDQELLDKVILPDFMEIEKSKSLITPSNLSRSSTHYKRSIMEIPSVDIE
jgi:hypothetical protein